MSNTQPPGIDKFWIQHQRPNHSKKSNKTLPFVCVYCPDRKRFGLSDERWDHVVVNHQDELPKDESKWQRHRMEYFDFENKEPFQARLRSCKCKVCIKAEKCTRTAAKDEYLPSAICFGSSSGKSSQSPSPRQSKARPAYDPDLYQKLHDKLSQEEKDRIDERARNFPPNYYPDFSALRPKPVFPCKSMTLELPSDTHNPPQEVFDSQKPSVRGKGQLWTPDDNAPLTRASYADPSNIPSGETRKSRAQKLEHKSRKPLAQQKPTSRPPPNFQIPQNNPNPPTITNWSTPAQNLPPAQARDNNYDIILQPETRPISQEQLVAEVKGIYAGLVMVEAKCLEVDNKQATLAQADPGAQPKLNNEQWQALIALHRTLLHEHHDFFLASQHPSASPALRRLASKYAMPARMWRHGIHSFLELLRHRLPASLDHMLAFIYLAYSMMALLYETVPAFEDTWIECLGDLGRYRMAIEDDDIRDREVWTGVARHWYSKASDKAPTTGRLYHHLAILARPNALQQLFYYAKSLCVIVPFTSARESILTLFEPVLNADSAQGQYRLPPLDTAFVKAHGLLFTNRDMEKFEPTVKEFLGLLDNQIGRVTRKFMEQGYYIAVANSVAMLGFASKDSVLMQAMAASSKEDVEMTGTATDDTSPEVKSFEHAQRLSNATLAIILQRIGDPNVLPFIHVTLVFMFHMARHPRAMRLLEASFPWEALTVMLNTLLAPYPTLERIESTEFPMPIKDDLRPFPDDFAMRGLLWADGYYPEKWFADDKIDEEDKYHEMASMTNDRKERILWLACRLASFGRWIVYDGDSRRFSTSPVDQPHLSRSSTIASATTVAQSET